MNSTKNLLRPYFRRGHHGIELCWQTEPHSINTFDGITRAEAHVMAEELLVLAKELRHDEDLRTW